MSEYVVLLTQINTAAMSPNPVSMNAQFTLSVSISEIQKTLEPEIWYSGEIYSGEV